MDSRRRCRVPCSGGFGTKIHAAVNRFGRPVALTLTAAQAPDIFQAAGLLAGRPAEVVIADKGYDGDALVTRIAAGGAEPVIPPMRYRRSPRPYDRGKYRLRNVAERLWGRLKQFRRGVTRYEKTARRFFAFVQLAAVIDVLKHRTAHVA